MNIITTAPSIRSSPLKSAVSEFFSIGWCHTCTHSIQSHLSSPPSVSPLSKNKELPYSAFVLSDFFCFCSYVRDFLSFSSVWRAGYLHFDPCLRAHRFYSIILEQWMCSVLIWANKSIITVLSTYFYHFARFRPVLHRASRLRKADLELVWGQMYDVNVPFVSSSQWLIHHCHGQ